MTLRSTIDSTEIRVEVEQLVAIKVEELCGDPKEPVRTDVFFEHGQWWARIWNLPAYHEGDELTYSVVDTSRGLELEEV